MAEPLLQQISDAVTAAGTDANSLIQYINANYPADPTLLQMAQEVNDDINVLIAETPNPPHPAHKK